MKLFAVQQENLTGKETRGLIAFWLLVKSYSKKAKIHSITYVRTHSTKFSWNKHAFPLEEPVLPLQLGEHTFAMN